MIKHGHSLIPAVVSQVVQSYTLYFWLCFFFQFLRSLSDFCSKFIFVFNVLRELFNYC